MNKRPPCAGKSALFDSTEYADHLAAKAICDTCPLLAACRRHLAETRAAASVHAYGPSGTWAGQLVGDSETIRKAEAKRQRDAEDSRYTEDEAKACALQWLRGERGEYVRIGRLVYERRGRDDRQARRERGEVQPRSVGVPAPVMVQMWDELAGMGLTRTEAAERMGVKTDTLNKAIARAKKQEVA